MKGRAAKRRNANPRRTNRAPKNGSRERASTHREAPAPPRPKPTLSIALPASIVSETPHLREKTARLGAIARILAVFRTEYITIFKDNPRATDQETELVTILLKYAATPQYLRRKLFPLNPTLQFAGIIPPLRTPNHQLNSKIEDLPPQSYREGLIISTSMQECIVDVGLPKPLTIPYTGSKPGQQIILRIWRNHTLRGEAVHENDVPHYFGIRAITQTASLSQALEGAYDIRIATSRLGEPVNSLSTPLTKALGDSHRALILLGSPSEGLHQIAHREGLNLEEEVNFSINAVPDQGTATVRTEEALSATLAILNYLTYEIGDAPRRASGRTIRNPRSAH